MLFVRADVWSVLPILALHALPFLSSVYSISVAFFHRFFCCLVSFTSPLISCGVLDPSVVEGPFCLLCFFPFYPKSLCTSCKWWFSCFPFFFQLVRSVLLPRKQVMISHSIFWPDLRLSSFHSLLCCWLWLDGNWAEVHLAVRTTVSIIEVVVS